MIDNKLINNNGVVIRMKYFGDIFYSATPAADYTIIAPDGQFVYFIRTNNCFPVDFGVKITCSIQTFSCRYFELSTVYCSYSFTRGKKKNTQCSCCFLTGKRHLVEFQFPCPSKSIAEMIGHNNLSLRRYFRESILRWQYRITMFECSSTVTVD